MGHCVVGGTHIMSGGDRDGGCGRDGGEVNRGWGLALCYLAVAESLSKHVRGFLRWIRKKQCGLP